MEKKSPDLIMKQSRKRTYEFDGNCRDENRDENRVKNRRDVIPRAD
ncbi:hypothetical protein L21SP2_0917 [Salinispira pacifica]|uniref:Uncharacterized protein n=1 Tax=Salinispira pacifica TaxID=1307761 RepID=V5WEV7_9SPIO|nr:hypothetical protein L21SP2_0917 [Salinispira pacifica]